MPRSQRKSKRRRASEVDLTKSPTIYLVVLLLLACSIVALGPSLARYFFFSI